MNVSDSYTRKFYWICDGYFFFFFYIHYTTTVKWLTNWIYCHILAYKNHLMSYFEKQNHNPSKYCFTTRFQQLITFVYKQTNYDWTYKIVQEKICYLFGGKVTSTYESNNGGCERVTSQEDGGGRKWRSGSFAAQGHAIWKDVVFPPRAHAHKKTKNKDPTQNRRGRDFLRKITLLL